VTVHQPVVSIPPHTSLNMVRACQALKIASKPIINKKVKNEEKGGAKGNREKLTADVFGKMLLASTDVPAAAGRKAFLDTKPEANTGTFLKLLNHIRGSKKLPTVAKIAKGMQWADRWSRWAISGSARKDS
jgi:hypothetical protein